MHASMSSESRIPEPRVSPGEHPSPRSSSVTAEYNTQATDRDHGGLEGHGDGEDDDGRNGPRSSPRGKKPTSAQSFTPRSLLVGLAIGTLITFSNTYFGLQTGWMSTMSMPSSLIGFAVFKTFSRYLSFPFSPIENVLIQTVAGAVGTMPLGCGFVGVIPALEYLLRDGPDGERGGGDTGQGEGGPLKLTFWKLIVWSLGVCLFGVVFAVPLRKEVIIREKLKFPSGTATALMIKVLHGDSQSNEKRKGVEDGLQSDNREEMEGLLAAERRENVAVESHDHEANRLRQRDGWKFRMRLLILSFAVSAFYTLVSYFIPIIRNLPIFGVTLAGKWLWTLNPSPAYIGQGIIMGPSTSLHMLVGAAIGWGILSPLAKHNGWASGPVDDWERGSKGWIVWVSLAIMLADSIINLGWLVVRPLVQHGPTLLRNIQHNMRHKNHWTAIFRPSSRSRGGYSPIDSGDGDALASKSPSEDDDAPPSELISTRTVLILLPLTLILNVICMHISFGNIITPFLSTIATLLALVLSIMGVRALGETDLNPVSGISKLTQLIFALATPASTHTRRSAVVTNLLAGAVSESGALQAGDMMQDLKTGHILGASPKAQFYGQLIGSVVGALISAGVYRMYVKVYEVPGEMFQIPTAYVWIFTARLVTGQGLPEMAWPAAGIASVVFAAATVLRIAGTSRGHGGGSAPWRAWIPGGIAVAVGMYNVPSFTFARAIGGIIVLVYRYQQKRSNKNKKPSQGSTPPTTGSDQDQSHNSDYGHIDGSIATADGPSQRRYVLNTENDEDDASSTIVILASGLILGEGVVSIVNLALASAGVPHL